MQEYTVIIGGIKHTVQLSDEDAKRSGAVPVETKQDALRNKAATPRDK